MPLDALAAGSFDPDTPAAALTWAWTVVATPLRGSPADPLNGGALRLLAQARGSQPWGVSPSPCTKRFPPPLQFTAPSAPATSLYLSISGGTVAANVAALLSFQYIVTAVASDGCSTANASVAVTVSCAAALAITPGPVAIQVRRDLRGPCRA